MKRIIVLILGIASVVWVLRTLTLASGPSLGDQIAASSLPDCQSSSPLPAQNTEAATDQANMPSAAIVRPVKYSVLVADADDGADAAAPKLTPADGNSADRAALGRWATGLVNALFNHRARLPAPSTAAQSKHDSSESPASKSASARKANTTNSTDDATCGDMPRVSAEYGSANASDNGASESTVLREAPSPRRSAFPRRATAKKTTDRLVSQRCRIARSRPITIRPRQRRP